MDKETYLKRKGEAKAEMEIFQRESFCYQCFRLEKNCLCHLIKPFETKTHFVLLMHPMEAKNNFPNATFSLTNTFFHGTSPVITEEQINYIGEKVDEFMGLFK